MKMYTLLLRANQPMFGRAASKASNQLWKATAIGACTYYLIVGSVGESFCAGNEENSNNNNNISSRSSSGGGDNGNNNNTGTGRDKPDEVDNYIKSLRPVLEQLGFGGLMGFCSGIALKRVGQIAAYCVGFGFIGFQAVKYYTGSKQLVDLDKLKSKVEEKIDQDGDGKFGTSDLLIIWNKFRNIMTDNLPNAGGFSGGFFLALYYS